MYVERAQTGLGSSLKKIGFKSMVAGSLALLFGGNLIFGADSWQSPFCDTIKSDIEFRWDGDGNTVGNRPLVHIGVDMERFYLTDVGKIPDKFFDFQGRTMRVDFGADSGKLKKFELNSNSGFYGNLVIGGEGDGNGSFSGLFQQDFYGDITMEKLGSRDIKLVFRSRKNFAELRGSIINKANRKNSITFGAGSDVKGDKEVGYIKGGVMTYDEGAQAKTNIVFKGDGEIRGNISSVGGSDDSEHGNFIVFEKRGKISDVTVAQGGFNKIGAKSLVVNADSISVSGDSKILGRNTISSADSGQMRARVISAQRGVNNISFGGAKNSLDIGEIIAHVGGVNNIVFDNIESASSAKIGKIVSEHGENNIVLRMQKTSQRVAYSVDNNEGRVNFVVQGLTDTVVRVDYARGSVTNIMFAGSNDERLDDFEKSSPRSDGHDGKVLGRVYKDGVRLSLQDRNIMIGRRSQSLLAQYASEVAKGDNKVLVFKNKVEGGANKISVDGLFVGDLARLEGSKSHSFDIDLAENSTFAGRLNLPKIATNIVMQRDSKLMVDNPRLDIQNLEIIDAHFTSGQMHQQLFAQKNTVVDLASMGSEVARKDFRLLTVGGDEASKGFVGSDALFKIYVNTRAPQDQAKLGGANVGASEAYGHAYSDRVVIRKGRGGVNHIQVVADNETKTSRIAYSGGGTEKAGNIALATVKDGIGITFDKKPQTQIIGFDVVESSLVAISTDENGKLNGNKGYTTYFLKAMTSKEISRGSRMVASRMLNTNYDLYLANFNSLNKRMGELRENEGAHGLWIRAFNGMQRTNFGLENKSLYTTIQAGYDFTKGFYGASNYLGFSLAYANSLDKSKDIAEGNGIKGIRQSNSNAVEFAIYNAYVQDGASSATEWKNGIYSDSVLKFSYILGSLSIFGQDDAGYNTSNLAATFSQELGYRFLFGEDKEFYIDPQVEVGVGYFSQSDLRQTMGVNSLDGTRDGIVTIRSRAGTSLGYSFSQFLDPKSFGAKAYVGGYFVNDFISGGNVRLASNSGVTANFHPIESTSRFVMNIGANFEINKASRIYLDFEKSFGGKIITDYQVNLGVRYSFGTSKYVAHSELITESVSDAFKRSLEDKQPAPYKSKAPQKSLSNTSKSKKVSKKTKKMVSQKKPSVKVVSKVNHQLPPVEVMGSSGGYYIEFSQKQTQARDGNDKDVKVYFVEPSQKTGTNLRGRLHEVQADVVGG